MKNEEIEITCDICLDLIPLVNDHVASEASRHCVLHHVEHCPTCKAELNMPTIQYEIDDQKIIKTIKKSIFMLGGACLIFGALGGISLTGGMGMFYNFTLMPFVGALSILIVKKKWFMVPLSVFILTWGWNVMIQSFHSSVGIDGAILLSAFYMAIIYTLFIFIGVLIMKLLVYALKRSD